MIVLLRTLEYYPGLVFLKTTRFWTIDEAFRSQIHLSLWYSPIGEEATLQIWRNNIAKVSLRQPEIKIDEQALITYAGKLYQHQRDRNKPWNGRQVVNAFKTAVAMAIFGAPSDGRPEISTAHFQQIHEASELFDEYLLQARRETIDDLATERQTRPSNDTRRDSLAAPRSLSGLESSSNSEQSSESEFPGSEIPTLHRGHASTNHSNPPGLDSSRPAAPPQPYGHLQPPQNLACPLHLNSLWHTYPNPWSPQMQQPVLVPAGVLHALQTSQPWSIPGPPQHQSQLPTPGTAAHSAAFSPFGYFQSQLQPNSQHIPTQPGLQYESHAPNIDATISPQATNHSAPSRQQYDGNAYSQTQFSHSVDATKSAHTNKNKNRHREKRRTASRASQEGRHVRQPGMGDDEGFWSRLNRNP